MLKPESYNEIETAFRPARGNSAAMRVDTGPEAGRLVPLPGLPCTLGRGEGTGRRVTLADPDRPPAVSRDHATLAVAGGRLQVTDHSRNGTEVDGVWLARGGTAALAEGSMLRLGPSLRLTLVSDGGAGSRSEVPPEIAASRKAIRERLADPAVLAAAWQRVCRNRGAAGPDGVTVEEYARSLDRRLARLREELLRGRYQPLPPRLFAAPKRRGGVRTISILTVEDRIVGHALHALLQPHIEPLLPACSFAYRPGRSAHDALRSLEQILCAGSEWVAESDIEAFFDRVSHLLLLRDLAEAVPDPFLLTQVSRCLAAGAAEPGRGLPQGSPLSPLLSNLFLAPFDRHLLQSGRNLVRYGDDFVIAAPSRGDAQAALLEAEDYLRSRRKLALRADRTAVIPAAAGFTFLGFRFTGSARRPAPEAVEGLRERLDEALPGREAAVLRGWSSYYGAVPPENAAGPIVERLHELFAGREDAHARLSREEGRLCFTARAGGITAEDLRAHLAGDLTLAAFLHRRDGRVLFLVLDLDTPGRPRDGRAAAGGELAPVEELALSIMEVCAGHGIPALLEDSGRRGRHVWLRFEAPVDPDTARRFGRRLAARAGWPREGVRLEVFPRHQEWPGELLGDAVKLPLGLHPGSLRRSRLLHPDGTPAGEPLELLRGLGTLPAERLAGLERRLSGSSRGGGRGAPAPRGSLVARLCEQCSVVRGLRERAAAAGHLRHTDNLTLLYTAGRLGEEGARFVHQVIGLTDNYSQPVCQKYLDSLEPDRKPLSCARIREWLEETGARDLCTCPGSRRTPLEGLLPAREANAGRTHGGGTESGTGAGSSRSQPVPESLWDHVAADVLSAEEDGEEDLT